MIIHRSLIFCSLSSDCPLQNRAMSITIWLIPRGAGQLAEIALKAYCFIAAVRAPFEPDPGHAGEGTDTTVPPFSPDSHLSSPRRQPVWRRRQRGFHRLDSGREAARRMES
ncbi:protein of unknown function [Candidatus Filomicrobium marinum]|uniref:Uncharacterized protein n=1 Tax=Candidatus Filomicrobium marinum TaxID=1608628 RepID=A0A0D6J9X1_9HYPH|nr:protein of unknown function [Candidatus Filomicrobium marinum]CPR15260.1 protein of unknown function [Candidatus Filomicrobium marinum]